MLVLAATGIAAFNTTAYIGLSGTTALNVLLLQSCLPLVVAIWAFALFRERPSHWQLVAVAISLAMASRSSPRTGRSTPCWGCDSVTPICGF